MITRIKNNPAFGVLVCLFFANLNLLFLLAKYIMRDDQLYLYTDHCTIKIDYLMRRAMRTGIDTPLVSVRSI